MLRLLRRLPMLLAGVALLATTVVVAQQQIDPAFQGRILQRSNGALYVYKDGLKFRVLPADMTDDQISAIPDGSPLVERVDQLFAQADPAAASLPGAAVLPPPLQPAAPPPAPAVPPPPGTLLYQADWSTGSAGWGGSVDWKILNGMLINDGTVGESLIAAPYEALTPDYAIEVSLQRVRGDRFGIVIRQTERQTERVGYRAWLERCCPYNGWYISTQGGDQIAGGKGFDAGTIWHTYRFEARGNALHLIVDGAPFLDAIDNRYLTGTHMSLVSNGTQINVRSFRIIAL